MIMESRIKVLITAGGTSEKIDDVRVVTNISTGRLGAAIADAFGGLGADVLLLRARNAAAPSALSIRHEEFFSSGDLEQSLERSLKGERFHAVLMAAAVADFVPVCQVGKISSESERITIDLKRRAKILPKLREWGGEDCVLVGFKLLSRVSDEELEASASAQLKRCALDFVVANEFSNLSEHSHPILLCRRDGCTKKVNGSRVEVALFIATEVMRYIQKLADNP